MTDRIASHIFMKCPACNRKHKVEIHEQTVEFGSQHETARRLYYLCRRDGIEYEFEDVLMEENAKNSRKYNDSVNKTTVLSVNEILPSLVYGAKKKVVTSNIAKDG